MFSNFASIVWSGTGTSANETDYSLSGQSRKITFSALNQTAIMSFTPVNLSAYEEITLQILYSPRIDLDSNSLISITVGTDEFTIDVSDRKPGWNHILIDCAKYTNLSSITFTCKCAGLVMLVDLIGYRKTTHETLTTDLVTALKNKIALTYDVTTTNTAAIVAGSNSISYTSPYIFENSQIQVNDITHTETHRLIDKQSTDSNFAFSYAIDSTITAKCPTVGEDSYNYDPVCGIVVTNMEPSYDDFTEKTLDGAKWKNYISQATLLVYIECSSKLKLHNLSSQYNENYGTWFNIILDGEIVEVSLDTTAYNAGELDTVPRQAYYYNIMPQPVTMSKRFNISTFNLTMGSK